MSRTLLFSSDSRGSPRAARSRIVFSEMLPTHLFPSNTGSCEKPLFLIISTASRTSWVLETEMTGLLMISLTLGREVWMLSFSSASTNRFAIEYEGSTVPDSIFAIMDWLTPAS